MAGSFSLSMNGGRSSQVITIVSRSLTTFIRSGSLYNVIGKGHGQAKDWTYHDQMAVDKAAAKPSIRLTPYQMLYAGNFADGSHLVKSAQYLQKELPIRIARRIVDFQRLSYIITANPVIYDVYELYLRAFKLLSSYPKIEDLNAEVKYSQLVRRLLDDHQNVVLCLAEGFDQVKDHIPYETMATFLDRTLTSRLGIRMLAEHHLGLRHDRPNFIGVICTNLSVKMLIERCGDYARL